MATPPLSRLDHVIIAVRTLDEAAATYRRLGFTLTPRGVHEGRGTGNHCIMFKDSYIELLGIVDETGVKGRLAERVNAQGEGGMGIAYGADDADATAAALRAVGIAAEDPIELSRPIDLEGQRKIVKFRNVMMPGLTLPNVMQFVCTHLTPELTRARHEWQLHPNGATKIREIVVDAGPRDVEWSKMQTAFGLRRTQPIEDGLVVALDNCRLAFLNPTLRRRGTDSRATDALTPRISGLMIDVSELDAAAAMLEMARVPNRETRNSVVVPASAAHGVVIEFAEA